MKDKTILSDDDVQELILLGSMITDNLMCDLNDTGFPCRTDRLAAVELMQRYLAIHDVVNLDPTSSDFNNYLTIYEQYKMLGFSSRYCETNTFQSKSVKQFQRRT